MLLCLVPEPGFGRRRACRLRLVGVGGPVPIVLLLETSLLAKSRPAFVAGLAAVLWRGVIAGFVAPMRAAIGRSVFAPRCMRRPFPGRLSLGRRRHRLDTDVVFLVGTPDFDGEGIGGLLGNLELGGGVHDADGA